MLSVELADDEDRFEVTVTEYFENCEPETYSGARSQLYDGWAHPFADEDYIQGTVGLCRSFCEFRTRTVSVLLTRNTES
jgi:hypothetical protein